MSALWEIDEQIANIMDMLVDEETGEINEEAMKQLEQLEIDREIKLENCGIAIKNLMAEVEAIQDEIKALKRRAETKAHKIERLAEYVKKSLKGETFETSKVVYGYRKSEKVEIIDEDMIPDKWCNFETTKKPIKSEIKKAIKNGEEVPGCVVIENINLQIK